MSRRAAAVFIARYEEALFDARREEMRVHIENIR